MAEGNSRLVYGISQALAGPLLDLAEEPYIAAHVKGGSSTGKSTALEAAASVWGRPDARDAVRSWRSTDNALEGIAGLANDGFLALDEMGQISPDVLAASLYMLANGAGKARANVDGSTRAVRSWRTSVFSTGERTPEAIIRTARKATDNPAGLDVRMICIPADAGAGMGLFEDLHGHAGPQAFADAVKAAAARSYGTAGRAWVQWLVGQRDPAGRFAAGIRAEAAKLAAAMTPAGADGQVGRVMTKAGLVAVAGEMAISAGILPWTAGAAEASVRRCVGDWLSVRGGTGAREEIDVLRQVQAFVSAHGAARFEDTTADDAAPVRDRAGWRNAKSFLFTAPAFEQAVAPATKKFAAQVLAEAGYMRGTKAQPWPVGGQQTARCYAVAQEILEWSAD